MSPSPSRPRSSRAVHVVVPAGIDDPSRPSGGNVYDRRLCDELPQWGWTVLEHHVPGSWPTPNTDDSDRFDALLAQLPDDSLVLVDGLIASAAERLVPESRRLRVVVLLHMPDATERVEAMVLNAAAGIITTSQWSRAQVIERHGLPAERVQTAVPGVDPAPHVTGSPTGRNLLVVGPVTPAKGHDALVAALAEVSDLDWHCTCVGALDLDPDFVATLRASAERAGIATRLAFTGPLARHALETVRWRTDLVISASRREAYGMAVSEGLAAGVPVLATEVGGHREAVGQASDGTIPGMLLAVDDVDQLASAVRRWLTDPATRSQWRESARLRRLDLADWSATARTVSDVLTELHSEPGSPPVPI